MADLLGVQTQWGKIQDGWQADLFDGAFRIR